MNAKELEQSKRLNKSIGKFCDRYHATARPGRPLQKIEPISYNPFSYKDDDVFNNVYMNTVTVPSVELTISEEDFQRLMSETEEIDSEDYKEYLRLTKALGQHFIVDYYSYKHQMAREEAARNKNPGVQKAWENYQLMLKLAGG